MSGRISIFTVTAFFAALAVISGCARPAAQPQPVSEQVYGTDKAVQGKVITRVGETVRLFHGGTKEAQKEFCLNETVPVYRLYYDRYATGLDTYREVGKVKITKYAGKYYVDAVVVEGEVENDDVAMKKDAACLVRVP